MVSIDGIILPDNMQETDEFIWTGLEASKETADNGRLHIFENVIKGRPFDLIGKESLVWVERSVLKQIQALTFRKNAKYTLIYYNETITCRWRHWEPPVIEARRVLEYTEPNDGDFYTDIKFKLIEVE